MGAQAADEPEAVGRRAAGHRAGALDVRARLGQGGVGRGVEVDAGASRDDIMAACQAAGVLEPKE
jgi:hypothetical protein